VNCYRGEGVALRLWRNQLCYGNDNLGHGFLQCGVDGAQSGLSIW
jgi:hypothetical protein